MKSRKIILLLPVLMFTLTGCEIAQMKSKTKEVYYETKTFVLTKADPAVSFMENKINELAKKVQENNSTTDNKTNETTEQQQNVSEEQPKEESEEQQ